MSQPHPWRTVRHLEHVTVCFTDLPAGTLGYTDGRTRIWIDRHLTQAKRRCTIAHELAHLAMGHDCGSGHRAEKDADQWAARWLLPLDLLLGYVTWARSIAELADELGVDTDTLTCRLEHLHPSERAAITRALQRAEQHA